MFEIILNEESNQPLYQILYTLIRNNIRSGKLPNGRRLPSVRALHLQLNISKTPIETAYQMLISEGFVVSKPRSGFYVVSPHTKPQHLQVNNNEQHEHSFYPTKDSNLLTNKPFIDFNPTVIDNKFFPIRTWNRVMKEAIANHEIELGKYGDPLGEWKLREFLCEYLFNSRGVNCLPEQILIGNGIVNSIHIISKLLSDRHTFAIEEPGYNLVRNQLLLNHFTVAPIPIDDSGLLVEKLDTSKIEAIYVTPSHQFPTGCIMPFTRREQLLKWAEVHDAYVIEDDYDSEFRYVGKPIPSLQGLDTNGRVIYIGTFSKIFTPVLRMNYMVIPTTLMEKMRNISHDINSAPSRIDQWAMSTFIEAGHLYRHIRRVRNSYRKKHQLLVKYIREHLSPHVEIEGENAGIHLRVKVKSQLPLKALMEQATAHGVKVYDFHNMWMNGKTDDYPTLYLGFAAISEEEIERGILLLKKAWLPLFLSS